MSEHLSILEALEKKDGPLARERMVAHIAAWQEFFIRNVPNISSKSASARGGNS